MRLTEAPVLPPLPPHEYARLRDSIGERGVLQPLLITADQVLIDGHEQWGTGSGRRCREKQTVGCLTQSPGGERR